MTRDNLLFEPLTEHESWVSMRNTSLRHRIHSSPEGCCKDRDWLRVLISVSLLNSELRASFSLVETSPDFRDTECMYCSQNRTAAHVEHTLTRKVWSGISTYLDRNHRFQFLRSQSHQWFRTQRRATPGQKFGLAKSPLLNSSGGAPGSGCDELESPERVIKAIAPVCSVSRLERISAVSETRESSCRYSQEKFGCAQRLLLNPRMPFDSPIATFLEACTQVLRGSSNQSRSSPPSKSHWVIGALRKKSLSVWGALFSSQAIDSCLAFKIGTRGHIAIDALGV